MSDDVAIPEDAPHWAIPLFVGGHLRDVKLKAIDEACTKINARLDALPVSPLSQLSPQTWAVIVTLLVGAIAAVFGVSVPTVEPVSVEAPPAVTP